jgi:HD-GYP domain-containing protein (c-di-GMP phosphodiesterase class II)
LNTGRLRLADLVAGLSVAADLGFGLPPDEAVRTCVVGVGLARRLELPEREVGAVFYTALLHHIGCTAFAHETSLVFGDELAMNAAAAKTNFADPRDLLTTFLPDVTRGTGGFDRARIVAFSLTRGNRFGRRFVTATCEVARETARRLGLPADVQEGLFHAYEWFNGGGAPQGLAGDAIPLPARIVRVASLAALFDSLGGEELALEALRRRAGGLLDPALVAAVTANAELLAGVNAGDPRTEVLELEPEPVRVVTDSDLPELALAFADVADVKSPFFHGHSRRVAKLATDAGERLGLGGDQVRGLQLAALLHDLGRVSVSDAIWEKPGPLTSGEWEQVRLHSYHSERIVAASEALRPLAALAGMHHERQNGSGYHRGLSGHSIPIAARILAACDVYAALSQERPHRPAREPAAAAVELRAEARQGRLDADVVECVLAAAGHATGKRRPWPAELTDREVEVLRLVAKGLSNREVGRLLVISPRTAEHHVQHVYRKIGVSSRAAAALFAMEHGLLD